MLLGSDRFCIRKRRSSPWSLAAHASVKLDPAQEQGGRSEQPPASGTWHGLRAGPAECSSAGQWQQWQQCCCILCPIPALSWVPCKLVLCLCPHRQQGQAEHNPPARLKWVSMELGSGLLRASRCRRRDSSSSSSPGCCGSKRLLCSTASLRCSRICVTLREPSTTLASGTEGWGHLPQSSGEKTLSGAGDSSPV